MNFYFCNISATIHVHVSQKLKCVIMWELLHIIIMGRRRYREIFNSALVYL